MKEKIEGEKGPRGKVKEKEEERKNWRFTQHEVPSQ